MGLLKSFHVKENIYTEKISRYLMFTEMKNMYL